MKKAFYIGLALSEKGSVGVCVLNHGKPQVVTTSGINRTIDMIRSYAAQSMNTCLVFKMEKGKDFDAGIREGLRTVFSVVAGERKIPSMRVTLLNTSKLWSHPNGEISHNVLAEFLPGIPAKTQQIEREACLIALEASMADEHD